jgi:hypothetical protein
MLGDSPGFDLYEGLREFLIPTALPDCAGRKKAGNLVIARFAGLVWNGEE